MIEDHMHFFHYEFQLNFLWGGGGNCRALPICRRANETGGITGHVCCLFPCFGYRKQGRNWWMDYVNMKGWTTDHLA